MLREGSHLSRKTKLGFCLVITSFGVTLLFVGILNKSFDKLYPTKLAELIKPTPWKQRVYIPETTSFETSPYNAANKRRVDGSGSASAGSKVIISWQAGRTLRVMATTSDMFQDCPVQACEVSPSSKSLPKARAIVFDDGRMNKQTPPQLNDKRVLVYYDMRTSNEVFFKAKGDLFSPYWKSAINWVWSYRLSSDIFEPFAYLKQTPSTGTLRRLADDATRRKSQLAVWLNPKVNRKEDSLEDLDKNFHKGKSQNGVEEFVKDLNKVLSFDVVDVIDLQAKMDNSETQKDFLLSKYYFIFAFEWVNCQDYVSDLFFYAFDPRVMAVPVVRGGVNYTQHFPKGTFINADDFESPRTLGKYLDKLATNTKSYSQMLLRKSRHMRESGVSHAWCQLCDMLHRLPGDRKLMERYEDIHAWSRENGRCVVSNMSEAEELSPTAYYVP